MKIAVDFDDVIVDTMQEFLGEWNRGRTIWSGHYITRNKVTNWNLPQLLKVPVETVKRIYDERVDYENIAFNAGAVEGIKQLATDGHDVLILTANPRYRDIRDCLNEAGLQGIPLRAGCGHKAGYCRDYNFDVLIDDRPSYLKGAVTVEVHAIRFIQPWNKIPEGWGSTYSKYQHNATNWKDVMDIVRNLSHEKIVDAISNLQTGKMKVVGSVQTGGVNFGSGNEIKTNTIIGRKPFDEVVTNAAGAKQTKIDGRYDLLPALAVKEVAKVLAEGADKYGVDNWKGLSIDEINNHVYAHLLNYQQVGDLEELSHAACRILMALQLHIEAEK